MVEGFVNLDLSFPPEFYKKCVERVDVFLAFFDEWLISPIMSLLQPIIQKLSVKIIEQF